MSLKKVNNMVPTLYLMCGLPGSGKTTLAKQLESGKNALRLTPDEWMERIVGGGYDEISQLQQSNFIQQAAA